MPCFEKTCTKDRPLQAGSLILIGWVILRVQPPGPNSPISPPSIRPAASQVKQPETTGTLAKGIVRKYRFSTRDEGSGPDGGGDVPKWGVSSGDVLLPGLAPDRRADGRPMVARCVWRPCSLWRGQDLGPRGNARGLGKVQGGRVSDDKYSLNIDSVLNRPFEGLALNPSSEGSRPGTRILSSKDAGSPIGLRLNRRLD